VRLPPEIAAGPREGRHQARRDPIGDAHEYHRDGAGLLLQDRHDPTASHENDVRIEIYQLSDITPDAVHVVAGPALLGPQVVALRPAELAKLLPETEIRTRIATRRARSSRSECVAWPFCE